MKIKICGLSEDKTLSASIDAGADFIGLVFYPPSPRYVHVEQAAALSKFVRERGVSEGFGVVGLFVDPDDQLLNRIVSEVEPDYLQLHGHETPERVRAVGEQYKLPVIKAIRVHDESDLDLVDEYQDAADWLLFDAKPPKADLPGGTGERFDWSILKDRRFEKPWMLSGGLDVDNVEEALSVLQPDAVDVSSGVESSRGVKDSRKIQEFIAKVRAVSA